MDLPFCLVDIIMKYAGAYHLDRDRRPYIDELKIIRTILPAQGVKVALLHLLEYNTLCALYRDNKRYIVQLYEDAMHLC